MKMLPAVNMLPLLLTVMLALPPRPLPLTPLVPRSPMPLASTVTPDVVTLPPVIVRLAVPPWALPVTASATPDARIVRAPGAESVPPVTLTAAFPAAPLAPPDCTVRVPVAPPRWPAPMVSVAPASPMNVPLPSTKNWPAEDRGGGVAGNCCVGAAANAPLARAIVLLRNNVSPAVILAAVVLTGVAASSPATMLYPADRRTAPSGSTCADRASS